MLFYLSLYLLAAVLVFQGVHALGEQSAPMGVVPAEVKTNGTQASLWGGALVAMGSALILAGLASHFEPWFQATLPTMRGLGFALAALHGVWLVFGRKVDYTPAPAASTGTVSHH